MPMNFFTPQTIRNIWGEWGRTPPEPGRQGQPADAAHPAGILPDPPGDSRCGVGAAGICGHGWKFLTGRRLSGQGRRSATRTEPEER